MVPSPARYAVQSPTGRPRSDTGQAWLDQFQEDAVLAFGAAWTVVANDVDDLVELGRSLPAAGPGDLGLDP
jgi:hypothetical protein